MGFSLNNLSNSLLKMGSSFLQMGTFYAATKAMNHGCGGSVFGGCCGGGGYYGGYYGGTIYNGGIYGSGYGLGQIAADRYMMGQAYGQGAALYQQISMLNSASPMMFNPMMNFNTFNTTTTSTTQQTLEKTNNPAADKVAEEQDTSLAEAFEQNVKDKKDTQFVSSDWKDMPEGIEKNDIHMDSSDEFGKSYIMHMDKTAGNSDGEITLDEFKAYNIKTDLGANATDDLKKAANTSSEIIFKKLDQNGDGKLDWKEMSSMFTVYDSLSDGKYDGVITNKELETGNKLMLDANNLTIDKKLRSAYNDLYGQAE